MKHLRIVELDFLTFVRVMGIELELKRQGHWDVVKQATVRVNYQLTEHLAHVWLEGQVIDLSPIATLNFESLKDTFIHEVCHIIAWEVDGDPTHGRIWQSYCKIYGCVPSPEEDVMFVEIPKPPEVINIYKQLSLPH